MITYRIVPADRPGPGKLEFGEPVDGVNLDELYTRTWAKAKWKEDEQDGDGGSKADDKGKVRGHAERFVLDTLSGGPKDCAAVELEAEGRAGLFGKATFRRAIRDLKDNGELASEPKQPGSKERVYRLVSGAEHLPNGVIRVDFGGCGEKAKLRKAQAQARVAAARMKRVEA